MYLVELDKCQSCWNLTGGSPSSVRDGTPGEATLNLKGQMYCLTANTPDTAQFGQEGGGTGG